MDIRLEDERLVFPASRNASVNKYSSNKEMWHEKGFKVVGKNDSGIYELSVDTQKFDYILGRYLLLGFINWKEYEELVLRFKDHHREKCETNAKRLGLEKNSIELSYFAENFLMRKHTRLNIGIITTENYSSGHQDFIEVLSSDYFNVLGIEVGFDNCQKIGFSDESEFKNSLISLLDDSSVDIIAILRGGGFSTLKALDSSDIAAIISKAEKPIIIGVGHSEDITLCDKFASVSSHTPSLAAVAIRDAFLPSLMRRLHSI